MRRHPARFLIAVALAEGLALAGVVAAWHAGLLSDEVMPWAAVGTVLAFAPFVTAAALAMPRGQAGGPDQPGRRSAASSARGRSASR